LRSIARISGPRIEGGEAGMTTGLSGIGRTGFVVESRKGAMG
jgi:hypothetical protein